MDKLTISLGKWFGVPVYLHWTWWIFGLFITIGNPTFAPIFLGVFAIILLHEFGHIFAAKYFKWPVYNVTLYPIGGAAHIEIAPGAFQEFVVAIAGPLVNVALMPFLYLAGQHSSILAHLSLVNVVILVFNLLPIFPMDGGRVFRAVLEGTFKDRLRATYIAARVGQCLCVLMGLYAISITHFILLAIAIFIALAAEAELQSVKVAKERSEQGRATLENVSQSADMIDDIQRRIDRYRNDFDR